MANAKRGGRPLDTIRPVEVIPGFHKLSEGSALYRAGGTLVLATASIDDSVPDFMAGRGRGWVTAEYQMHPRSNPKRRESRDGRERPLGGRAREIQRLIGRALRAAVDLDRLGERSVTIDCDVLEADGGTRTAAVTGSWVALAAAISQLKTRGLFKRPPLRDQVAAVSVGHVDGQYALDLCYLEDSSARPTKRWISRERPLRGRSRPSRFSRRLGLARGCIWYSAVTQPVPRPFMNSGTVSSIDAVHSTTVPPARYSTEPSERR